MALIGIMQLSYTKLTGSVSQRTRPVYSVLEERSQATGRHIFHCVEYHSSVEMKKDKVHYTA